MATAASAVGALSLSSLPGGQLPLAQGRILLVLGAATEASLMALRNESALPRYIVVNDPFHQCALVVDLENPRFENPRPEVLAATRVPAEANKITDALNEENDG